MYRKLKNILGVSLMVLAVLLAQIPMPEAQAEIENGNTVQEDAAQNNTITVTFSMNGGNFYGSYNDYEFKNQSPVLVLDSNEKITVYPSDKGASYNSYRTDKEIWYTDKECLTVFDKESEITKSITLYKKWYNITSDGTTLADKGFYISSDGRVLYKYDGSDLHVAIPDSVTVIAAGAFETLEEVRGITLPPNIEQIDDNAFSGAESGEKIIYVYDSQTEQSKRFGKLLDEKYEQLVYSEYLDKEKVEEMVGIDYSGTTQKGASLSNNAITVEPSSSEESSETKPSSSEESSETKPSSSEESSETKPSSSEESSETKPSSSEESSETKPSSSEESSETKPSSSEESSETKPSSSEESSETEPSSSEESSETKPSSSEESSETKPSSSEESSETEPSSSEESSETKPSSSEESSEEPSSPGVIEIDPDKKYTVTFKTGISDVSGENREVLNGRTVSEMVSIDGKQPTILKKGEFTLLKDDGSKETTYTFEGWYKDSQYTFLWDFANDTVEGDTTLYAKWSLDVKAYFTVTFKAEGAKNIPDPIKVYEGEKLNKPSKTPKIANKEFKGWYTGEADSAKKFSGWNKPITENMTLYAKWEDNGYSVTFHMNGGGFTGNYDGGEYNNAASIKTKVALGKGIDASAYPESVTSAAIKYNSYNTDSNWYTDKECLSPYTKKDSSGTDNVLKNDITLYKKWYYTNTGFTMNPSGAVLYKYNGSSENVVIPSTVTTIGENAFANVNGIASITLPEKIADVRSNAFSGLENVSKDVTITAPANAENAQKKAQELAKQYTHLVYKSPENNNNSAKKEDNKETVSVVDAGTIKLGASGIGNNNSSNNQEETTDKNNNTSKITVGVNGTSILGATAQQISNAVTLANAQAQANAAKVAAIMDSNTGTAGTTGNTNGTAAASQVSGSTAGTAANTAQTSNSTTNASSASGSNTTTIASNATSQTTVRNSAAAASAPRSNEHIKDATPKTGDPIQYRMLLVCCLFSIGVLLLLTGNGNKKKAAAS